MDADGSGEINVNEMISFLDEPSLKQYVEALVIDASDTQLAQAARQGRLRRHRSQQFCAGCMELKGEARALDVHTLIFQVSSFSPSGRILQPM